MNNRIYVGLSAGKTFRLIVTLGLLLSAGRAFDAAAQVETNLYSFVGLPTDGRDPFAKLVQGRDGNFYGTTFQDGYYGDGTVFRISPSGTYTSLYSFFGFPYVLDGGDGPIGDLVQGSDGNFYGTTYYGGASLDNANCAGIGCGTVFQISPSGTKTTLYSFVGSPRDGSNPGGLAQGSEGNFYGTTEFGGTNNAGTVFRVSPSGTETTLYSFGTVPNDGSNPFDGLVQGSDGNFYGTTSGGGTNNAGTVFRISPGGTETTLYSFGSVPNDGSNPFASLVQGSDGNFYGTTYYGGASTNCSGGCGTVFQISPSGSYTSLYSFVGSPNDGWYSQAPLVQGSDGNFYGTTENGGTNNAGVIFRISPSSPYTVVYSFVGPPNDGRLPDAGLVQGSDGNFYGTTTEGGTNNYGTVFRLTVPLKSPPWPINQITGIQLLGTNIVFAIPSIACETYQLQFSSSMNPTDWVNVPGVSVTNSIGALLTLTNFGGASLPQVFYRFDITP